jgi:hypothetical protein
MRFPNPLIPGFNPDPSVVLADGVGAARGRGRLRHRRT